MNSIAGLGADTRRVVRLVMVRGAVLVARGRARGRNSPPADTPGVGGAQYGVAATDLVTFGTMAVVLALVALAAWSGAGAPGGARVDPAVALRCE